MLRQPCGTPAAWGCASDGPEAYLVLALLSASLSCGCPRAPLSAFASDAM